MAKLLVISFIMSCMPLSISLNLKIDNNFKDIDIKNRTYYFFDDMIDMKNLNSSQINIDKNAEKNVFIYFIGYMAVKDLRYVKTNTVYP